VRALELAPGQHARWALFVAIAFCDCNGPELASRAQCELLRDRFVSLELSSDPSARALTPEGRAALRGRLAVEALTGPQAAKLGSRCEEQVTAAAYKCAAGANTIAAWRGCLE
jgi:hypothetical protein